MTCFSYPLRRIQKDDRGMSSVEFALLLPVMTAMYFGAVELSAALIADRKATAVASTAADLAAQSMVLNNAQIADIFGASTAILEPFDGTGTRIILSSVSDHGGGNYRVDWSDALNATAYARGASYTVPDDLIIGNGSVIVAEVTYTYSSTMGKYLTGDLVMEDVFYARPRRTLVVARVN